jgi:Tol biopolymer transport system component
MPRTVRSQQRVPPLLSGYAEKPRWSPDGKHIAFYAIAPGANRPSLGIVKADGKEERILRTPILGDIDWAPDGKSIAFGEKPTAAAHIAAIGIDGKNFRILLISAFQPRYSPDGNKLLFVTYTPRYAVAIQNADGSGERLVLDGVFVSNATNWNYDGGEITARRLIAASRTGYYIQAPNNDSTPRRFPQLDSFAYVSDWQ